MQKRTPANDMRTSLRGIAERARRDRKARFRDLYRLLNEANFRDCFHELRKSAAPGVDGVTCVPGMARNLWGASPHAR